MPPSPAFNVVNSTLILEFICSVAICLKSSILLSLWELSPGSRIWIWVWVLICFRFPSSSVILKVSIHWPRGTSCMKRPQIPSLRLCNLSFFLVFPGFSYRQLSCWTVVLGVVFFPCILLRWVSWICKSWLLLNLKNFTVSVPFLPGLSPSGAVVSWTIGCEWWGPWWLACSPSVLSSFHSGHSWCRVF